MRVINCVICALMRKMRCEKLQGLSSPKLGKIYVFQIPPMRVIHNGIAPPIFFWQKAGDFEHDRICELLAGLTIKTGGRVYQPEWISCPKVHFRALIMAKVFCEIFIPVESKW